LRSYQPDLEKKQGIGNRGTEDQRFAGGISANGGGKIKSGGKAFGGKTKDAVSQSEVGWINHSRTWGEKGLRCGTGGC